MIANFRITHYTVAYIRNILLRSTTSQSNFWIFFSQKVLQETDRFAVLTAGGSTVLDGDLRFVIACTLYFDCRIKARNVEVHC